MKQFTLILKALFVSIILMLSNSYSYSQTGLLISPNSTFGVCPGESIAYTAVDNDHSMTSCMYSWTVTNGIILKGSTTNGVSTFQGTVNFNMLEKLYK